ncbi:hypothetical protein [Marinihelvus fidelis]|uniref:hypothetical protein n=1 Tax=Marinihelvus fidelis TaxID=2613842 RepID=UPI0017875C56|nr:hypothetical protein [Marinihelvus fidelis]
MLTPTRRTLLVSTLGLLLLALSASAIAKPSNKWRLEFSGNAESDGEIVIRVLPEGGEAIETTTSVNKGLSENHVARAVVEAMQAQLPGDVYHVERDDGEDVLVKRHHGQPDFDIQVVSNTVKDVRNKQQRE